MNAPQAHTGGVRDVLIFLAKVAVSAALIGFVVSRISLAEIRVAMLSPRWGWLLASLASYGLSAVGGAWQWSLILRTGGVAAAGAEIRRLYFIGLFFNNFLPANIGGDAYKIIDLGRRERRPLAVFCATLLDRLLGLAALSALAVVVLLAATAGGITLPRLVWLMVAVLALLLVLLALLLSRRLSGWLSRFCARIGLGGWGRRLAQLADGFSSFRRRAGWLGGIFALSMVIQFLRMATHLAAARGLGYELGAVQDAQLLVLIPLLAVSLTLPVTINGIGLREWASAKLLIWAGLTAPQAVAMEVAAYLVQVVFSLQGGILLWLGRWARRESDGN